MIIRRLSLGLVAAACCAAALGGCSKEESVTNPGMNASNIAAVAKYEAGYQLDKPVAGEDIAVMRVRIGDGEEQTIKIRLFPEAAPKAVNNFVTHAKAGYYNNLIFHRVEKDVVIQGGDPKGDGTGGESIYTDNEEKTFADEFTDKVFNLKGALAMANSGVDTNGSQFFFNMFPADKVKSPAIMKQQLETAIRHYSDFRDYYEEGGADFQQFVMYYYGVPPLAVPDKVLELYKQHGGNIGWDGAWRDYGGHTVFGQVFEGMEVLDTINGVGVNVNNKPDEPVTIVGIDIVKYNG